MKKNQRVEKSVYKVLGASLLAVFVCLSFFIMGVWMGKSWSDRGRAFRNPELTNIQSPEDESKDKQEKQEKQIDIKFLTKKKTKQKNESKKDQPVQYTSLTQQGPVQKTNGRNKKKPQPGHTKTKSTAYTVQIAAYKTAPEADNHCQKLIDRGFPAFPTKTAIDGKNWFRVSIGSFKTRREALRYEKALKKQTFIKNSFVRKVSRQ